MTANLSWNTCQLQVNIVSENGLVLLGNMPLPEPVLTHIAKWHHLTTMSHIEAWTWWRHQMETFSALLVICVRGIHRSLVNSPHEGQWRGALMFSLICVWINGRVNNREAGNLRRYRAQYDVSVFTKQLTFRGILSNPCPIIWMLCKKLENSYAYHI